MRLKGTITGFSTKATTDGAVVLVKLEANVASRTLDNLAKLLSTPVSVDIVDEQLALGEGEQPQ